MKKQLFCCLSATLLLTTAASAKIKFTDVKPDTVLSATPQEGFERFDIDMDNDGNVDFYVKHFNGGSFGIHAEFYTQVGGTGEVLVNGTNNPLALDAQDPINSTATTWVNKAGAMFSSALMMDPTFGGVGQRYVGVRIKKGSKWHYGWVKMSVTAGSTSMTLYEYGLNETADETIGAGQTAPTAINDVAGDAKISIYPNPMKEMATIEIPVANASLTLYNQYGQQVRNIAIGNEKKVVLYRESLGTGLYHYDLKQGNIQVARGKLIIVD